MILDFGCGVGKRWNGSNDTVVGIDVSLPRIRDARSRTSVVCCDGRFLPFRNSVFSLIISDSVLEHIDDYGRALLEIRRVLAANGTLKVWQPVDNDPIFIVARRVARSWMGDKIYSRFSSRQLLTTISSLFQVVHVQYLPNAPLSGVFGFFNRRTPRALENIDHLYGLICKKTTIFHWQAIIEAIKDFEQRSESQGPDTETSMLAPTNSRILNLAE